MNIFYIMNNKAVDFQSRLWKSNRYHFDFTVLQIGSIYAHILNFLIKEEKSTVSLSNNKPLAWTLLQQATTRIIQRLGCMVGLY